MTEYGRFGDIKNGLKTVSYGGTAHSIKGKNNYMKHGSCLKILIFVKK